MLEGRVVGRGGYRLVEGHSAVCQGRKTCGIRRSLPAPAMAPLHPSKVGYDCGAYAPLPVPGHALLKLIRPAILILAAVLASPAAAATLEEQAASAAVLEEEAVDANVNSSVLLSPQAAVDPGDPSEADRRRDADRRRGPTTVVAHHRRGNVAAPLGIDRPAACSLARARPTSPGASATTSGSRTSARTRATAVCRRDSGIFLSRSPTAAPASEPSTPYAANDPGARRPSLHVQGRPRRHGSRRRGPARQPRRRRRRDDLRERLVPADERPHGRHRRARAPRRTAS